MLAAYPAAEIEALWKDVLLNQFHDVLPGSSIKAVVDDAKELYAKVITKAQSLIDRALQSLAPSHSDSASASAASTASAAAAATSRKRKATATSTDSDSSVLCFNTLVSSLKHRHVVCVPLF